MTICVVCHRPRRRSAASLCRACQRSYDGNAAGDGTTASVIEWAAARAWRFAQVAAVSTTVTVYVPPLKRAAKTGTTPVLVAGHQLTAVLGELLRPPRLEDPTATARAMLPRRRR